MISEEGMCIFLSSLLDALHKHMEVMEQDLANDHKEIMPEFSERFGWFLHTTSVGAVPLTKYCLLQSIYVKVSEEHYKSPEITLCAMMELFTNEQLEVLLPIVFN